MWNREKKKILVEVYGNAAAAAAVMTIQPI
jgi:hypothetical protein